MKTHWYKNAVIYSLDVETYMDSNGDGIGDFTGLSRCLDYLSNLGVTCLWLLPFYPSPNRDNGYDVKDYYAIDDRLGNLGTFSEFLEEAEVRNIRVLADLVVNHTSIEHPWFREARKSKDSPYRDYYIWADNPPEDGESKVIFGEQQEGNWEYDEAAGGYYYHTFYKFQADLNLTNSRVQEEIQRIVRFWLRLGLSGFRMDAVTHMLRDKGSVGFEGDPHDFLRDLRAFVEEQRSDAILLAEVDVEPERYQHFFGDGDQMHLLLNFYLDNYLFLALAREEAAPIEHALERLPPVQREEQYANFLRNHDELDLERLSDEEREEVFKRFAPDENMRIFGRGVRRRLPPMLGGDRQRLELAYSLMFSLPGTPVLRYGQEIGMGEDLTLEGRDAVRTLMQWSATPNGGFSTAPQDKLIRPIIREGDYGYERVNVNDQRRRPDSLLNWVERLINTRKECPEFGWGEPQLVKTGHPQVFAHFCKRRGSYALAVHNLGSEETTVTLELPDDDTHHLLDLWGDEMYEPYDPEACTLRLNPYGYRWLRTTAFQPHGLRQRDGE